MKSPEPPPMCGLPEWLCMTEAERAEYSRIRMKKMREYGQASLAMLEELYGLSVTVDTPHG